MADSSGHDAVLDRLGFSFERGGAHTARTMMLEDLTVLLASVDCASAGPKDYLKAITDENCLGKRSAKTRRLTYNHLVDLYALDSSVVTFRALCRFWTRDPGGRPLLALICAYARDSLLRSSAPFVLQHREHTQITRQALETHIDDIEPGRFSEATLKSTAQNINSTFTKSGHLTGTARKIRSTATATPGSVAYSLLLGYLRGERGYGLFQTEYTKLLDCAAARAIELAEVASRSGWIVMKRIGEVIEVDFPGLLTDEEKEWVLEQD